MRVRTICSVLALCAIIGVVPAVQALVVNEIYYDGPGTDAGTFTEILGEPGFVLDGYSLVGVNGSDGLDYRTILMDGMVIPADGRLVIGQDTTVPDADYINTGVDWQNGPDQVQIRFGATIVDGICYGEAALLNCEGGTWGPDVAAGHSISRCPDGRDTDNNQADTAETLPTPGVTNDCPSLPVDMPLCEVVALDADGFPIHYGELVHITDPLLILNDDGTFTVGSLDAAATGGGCCVNLFDFNVNPGLMSGDEIDMTGTVNFYNGKVEIGSPGTTVVLLSSGNPLPDPTVITTEELALNGNAYEDCLISIDCLTIMGGTWPAEGENANIDVADQTGVIITLRIDMDTNIDGSPQPDQPFRCIGIAGQYDTTSPYFEGFQIMPRSIDDIEGGVPSPAIESSWGEIKTIFK